MRKEGTPGWWDEDTVCVWGEFLGKVDKGRIKMNECRNTSRSEERVCVQACLDNKNRAEIMFGGVWRNCVKASRVDVV